MYIQGRLTTTPGQPCLYMPQCMFRQCPHIHPQLYLNDFFTDNSPKSPHDDLGLCTQTCGQCGEERASSGPLYQYFIIIILHMFLYILPLLSSSSIWFIYTESVPTYHTITQTYSTVLVHLVISEMMPLIQNFYHILLEDVAILASS